MIVGSIDEVTNEGAAGWLYQSDAEEQMYVAAYLRDRVVGEAVVSEYREDLERVGFGDGQCGFRMKFNERVGSADLFFLTFKPRGSTLSIARTTNSSFVDFVQSATSKFPAAGRSRSVLGGLWTDRTDAQPILAGKLSLSRITPEVDRDLRSLITNGYIAWPELRDRPLEINEPVLQQIADGEKNRVYTPSAPFKTELNRLAGEILQTDVVDVLKEIFDDRPVIYGLNIIDQTPEHFHQLCAVEEFSSPAECMALYLATSGDGGRVDCIAGSHQMAEFTPSGRSRWLAEGASAIAALASEGKTAIKSAAVTARSAVLVGPGVMHRAVPSEGNILQVLLAPLRVTPIRFLSAEHSWIEVSHPSGARVRI